MKRKMGIKSSRVSQANKISGCDIVVFSHLRWDFVWQRPQHLLSRFARNQRVFFIEEPVFYAGPEKNVIEKEKTGIWRVVPHLKEGSQERKDELLSSLLHELFQEYAIEGYISWYYTPMAIPFTRHLTPRLVIYDCMDELSAFKGAPEGMGENEAELMLRADLVFTGGQSLYESKSSENPSVHAFPSSIDVAHFSKAREVIEEPADQADIPHPRLGFFGVIDERMDLDLIGSIAKARPDWHLVIIGPVVKINPDSLPKMDNIHYLGMKDYQELPAYLSGWDVSLMPFAQNDSTRFISPTKTLEYLAGGRQVVSTPVPDVVRPYGHAGLVKIAKGAHEFVAAVEDALKKKDNEAWQKRVDSFLADTSWEKTWQKMEILMDTSYRHKKLDEQAAQGHLTSQDNGTTRAISAEVVGNRNGRKKTYDFLIVGAGFAGSVLAERLARGSNKKVLVIDKRPHIAGNAYDHFDEAGLLIHKYGPHIFHTNSAEVFSYLSRFTKWRPYEHRVLASVDGQLMPMPINLDTINLLYGLSLNSFELEGFFAKIAEPREKIATSEDVVVSKVGREIYEKFFRNYTRKQWALDPSELDASVTSRVPIRFNRDDRYFTDVYQAMPQFGFTRMFENILDHPNIHVMLNADYRDLTGYVSYDAMVYTGPVDEYFNYRYGKLPYRSLQFKNETLDEELHQPAAVINYPNEHAYTRVTEFKYLTGQSHPKTSLVYEYPCAEGDPYYPIPRLENQELYKKYKKLADSTTGVYFAGRLGTYKYYNMDQVTAQALNLFARITGKPRKGAAEETEKAKFTIDMSCVFGYPDD